MIFLQNKSRMQVRLASMKSRTLIYEQSIEVRITNLLTLAAMLGQLGQEDCPESREQEAKVALQGVPDTVRAAPHTLYALNVTC
jgi:hypothetical protein